MSGTCKTVFNLIISSLGIVLGVASFVTFFCCYGNMDAGVWGLISGVLAAVCFQIHYLQYKEKLESWHSVETLNGLKLLGLMGFLAGFSGLCWYIFLASYKHIHSTTPPGESTSPLRDDVLLLEREDAPLDARRVGGADNSYIYIVAPQQLKQLRYIYQCIFYSKVFVFLPFVLGLTTYLDYYQYLLTIGIG